MKYRIMGRIACLITGGIMSFNGITPKNLLFWIIGVPIVVIIVGLSEYFAKHLT